MDNSVPAVVLKLDPNVFHHGGLGAIRTLGRLGVAVHVVHEDPFTPAAASRYVYGRWRWTPGPDRPELIREGLMRLAERIGRPAVLIPTDDAGAIFLAEHGYALRPWFLFPQVERGLPRSLADKSSLGRMTAGTAVAGPLTVLPGSVAEGSAFVDRVGLPVFGKLASPWAGAAGQRPRSTTLLPTREYVEAFCRSYAGSVVLQEAVPDGTDWFLHGYCDARSVCRPSFTGIKERSYPASAGLTTLGTAVDNERLRADVEQFLRELGYRGIVDLDLRWDRRTDRYRLLDFNPRVGAQFRLFEDAAGVDVVRAAYLDLTGQPIPEAAVRDRRFLVENYDPLAVLGQLRRGDVTLRSWLRSLRGVDETAWFARDDLAPFGLMCVRFGWRAVQRRFRPGNRAPADRPPRYRPGRARRRLGPLPDPDPEVPNVQIG